MCIDKLLKVETAYNTTINIGEANTSKAIKPTSTEKSIILSVLTAFFQRFFIFFNIFITFID